ncbi:uncharacterized protein K441DRAFT_501355, partial [Cenococcum geophilum 1.58]
LEAAKVSIYSERRPKIYFLCLGNKKLPIKEHIFLFYTLGNLSKYFKRKHLERI